MTNTEIVISEKLTRFVTEHAGDHHALELILFFAEYPYARFNELAIIHALNHNAGRLCIQKALGELVGKGVIKTHTDSNVPLYSLAENSSLRSLILELAKLDLRQRQALLRQAGSKDGKTREVSTSEKYATSLQPARLGGK